MNPVASVRFQVLEEVLRGRGKRKVPRDEEKAEGKSGVGRERQVC